MRDLLFTFHLSAEINDQFVSIFKVFQYNWFQIDETTFQNGSINLKCYRHF